MKTIGERMKDDLALCGMSEHTVESYLRYGKQSAQFIAKPPGRTNSEDVRAFLLYLRRERKLSAQRVNVVIPALLFLFDVTLRRGEVMREIPYLRVQHRSPVILSAIEVRALVDACASDKHRAITLLLYGSGLRVSEALGLCVQDLDTERGVIRLLNTKTRRERIVPLPPVTLTALRAYSKSHAVRGPLLFSGSRDPRKPLTREAVHVALRGAAARAGIRKRVYPHLFRHAFATHMRTTRVRSNRASS